MVDKFRKALQTGDPDNVDLLYRSLPGEAIAVQSKSWDRSRRWPGEKVLPLDALLFRDVVDALLEEQPLWNHRHNSRQQGWVDGLRAAGAEVDEVTLYLASPPAEPPAEVLASVRAGEVGAVTFTSSSTVRNLATLLDGELEPLRRAIVACIGPATAEAALEAGLPPDVLADEQSVDGLVAALRRYVREQQLTAEEAR